uniref:Uncharacterized protein n=1 Tax=viral metagenome TaxID=1070528 RepID=A0A6C0H7W4_9ZZZZ
MNIILDINILVFKIEDRSIENNSNFIIKTLSDNYIIKYNYYKFLR